MPQSNTPKRLKSGIVLGVDLEETQPPDPLEPGYRKSEETDSLDAFRRREGKKPSPEMTELVHLIAPGVVCDTESRGYRTPQGRSPFDIVVDASAGFIPLWEQNTLLRWRFKEESMDYFADPKKAKEAITQLFAEALIAWGSAAPVTFKYDEDLYDFQFVMRSSDQCSPSGCVLAAAFFPDGGRHDLYLYPKMFTQIHKEQVDTLIHEIGHIFGLRHFFAVTDEAAWPSEIFGRHEKFSIMNYGKYSELRVADKEDLILLYQSVWNKTLKQINGTPIRTVKPNSTLGAVPVNNAAFEVPPEFRPKVEAPNRSTATRLGLTAYQSRANAAFLDEV